MKKVININFQGTVVPIEEGAYELLRDYVDSLRVYFAEEEGRDEIINDIESRISELFQERLKDGATCITDADVNLIIDNMGRPRDFAAADNATADEGPRSEPAGQGAQYHSWQSQGKRLYRDETHKILGGVCSGIGAYLGVDPWIVRILFILSGVGIVAYIILWIFLPPHYSIETGNQKRLYRNPDDKIIGGVCGGIGSYFNINAWIPRVIFLLPFISFFFRWQYFGPWTFPNFVKFSFSPGTFLVYVILWIVIPEAKTTSEKLQMKGEKVDLNSIKESVVREMKGVAERMEKLGKDADQFVKEKGPQFSSEMSRSVQSSGGIIGRIIVTLVKIFVYIILGAVAFAVLATVFGIAIAAVGVFPLKDFIVEDGWQNLLAWFTLIFFIGVPVVGVTTTIVRWITRRKGNNHYFRNITIGLWIFGWICLFALISFVGRDFKYISSVNRQSIEMTDPTVDFLEISPIRKPDYRWRTWLSFEPYSTFDIGDDTALVPNISLKLVKADRDEFAVEYYAMSNGVSKIRANELADKINFSGYQQDSTLFLNNTIPINAHDKFRNQFVEVVVKVPVGHRVKVDEGFFSRRRSNFFVFKPDNFDEDRDNMFRSYRYNRGVEYLMRADGLYPVDDMSSPEPGPGYRYKGPNAVDSLRNEQEDRIREMEKSMDSVKRANKRELERIKDSLLRERNELDKKLQTIQERVASVLPDMPVNSSNVLAFFSFI